VGQAIVFRRLPFILQQPADFRGCVVILILFMLNRFVQVVIVSHHPSQQEQGDQ
jgi:hypothetical protein